MIDFAALTAEQRLALIETTLGLLPSGNDREGRAVYFCFQLAKDWDPEYAQDALDRLNAVAPGWFEDHVLPFRERGLRLPERESAPEQVIPS